MLNGCATKLPAYSAVLNRIPSLQPGYGRLYLYSYGGLSDPSVFFQFSINGDIVGQVNGFKVLYVDRPAGNSKITANTKGVWPAAEPKDIMLNLVAGETRYIRAEQDRKYVGFHFLHIRLVLMDSDQAMEDLKKCFYVGPSLPEIPKE
jgi:hypothetical protein